MTVQQVIEKLKKEKQEQLPSRYHCRAIMVRDIAQYIDLLERLKALNDVIIITVEDLFSGADVMPNYEVLMGQEYQNKWLILPGVSEYLRLFHANEEEAQRFGALWHYQSDATTVGRIIIPLWGCETLWFDKSLRLSDDIRQNEYYFNCSDDIEEVGQQMSVQVLSGDFELYMAQLETTHSAVFFGLREWYDFWCNPQENMTDQLILTRRYRSVRPTDGDIKIHVIRDTLSFLRENLGNGSILNADNCSKEAQEQLFSSALEGKTLDDAILAALNTHVFLPLDVMGKWVSLNTGQKQLIFLWYALHPDNSYLCYCISQCLSINDLPKKILMSVFPARVAHKEWVADSQALIAIVPITRDDDYFSAVDEIPSREERLEYLTANTTEERVYILRLVGQWLRDDEESVLQCTKLKVLYPALAAYLDQGYPDGELGTYFGKYKKYKLSNTLPQDQELYFSGIDTERYDYRYPALCECLADQTAILWIDALGAEWLPLLKWALATTCDGTLNSTTVAQAQLPTETCFNDQWNQMDLPHEKYDKLDKLAHKGVIDDNDYYVCIEEQIHFVIDISQKVNQLLKKYARVIITGDHGTSRLAARFFHKLDGFPADSLGEVGSHGRFCKISNEQPAMMETQKIAKDMQGNKYLVFTNYDHFKKSGFAAGAEDDVPIYGEVHGGGTPEEVLIPVITVDSPYEFPLTAKWAMRNNSVKIRNKSAKCEIVFSKAVTALQAKSEGFTAECITSQIPSKEWTIVFKGLKVSKTKLFDISVVADGVLVEVEPVEIKPALGGDDPF